MSTKLHLPHRWEPRDYQLPAWRAFNQGFIRFDMPWHRRAGKDLFWLNLVIRETVRNPGIYWHVLPEYKQARKVIWQGKTHDGRSFLDHWPAELVARKREDDMMIETTTDSLWQLVGGDNYNANVGTNPRGIVFSEFSLTDPDAWTFARPILAANGGWAAFIYTPRGRNHAYRLHQRAQKNPRWFSQVLTVDDTGAVPKAAIEADREEGMSEALIQQEYYCSFDAPLEGAYYDSYLVAAQNEKRICEVPWDSMKPVMTAWDLGIGDATAIWFFQHSGQGAVRLIEFYRSANVGLEHYTKVLAERPYTYLEDLLPWDAGQREQGTGKTKAEVLRSLGRRVRVVPKIPFTDGINATRALFPRFWFDEVKCEGGLQALREYTKEWDPENKVYRDKPLHNWACLAPETEILTSYGERRMIDLPETGEVSTPWGWKPYVLPRITRRNASLVEVVFDDGFSLRCTPEHRFLTESGWRFAAHLEPGSKILSASMCSLKSSKANSGVSIPRRISISSRAVWASFIETFGKVLSARFRLGTTSITGMEIAETIGSRISNACIPPSTTESATDILGLSARRLALPLQIGIALRWVESGIDGKPSVRSRGSNGRELSWPASSVDGRSWGSTAKALLEANSAPSAAGVRQVTRVVPLDERSDVWCLTVPDSGCFALANGAVVANSHPADALRTLAVGLRAPMQKRERLAPRVAIV